MNPSINYLVRKYEKEGDFSYTQITKNQIKEAQNSLSLNLPKSYIEFLRIYGQGGIGGCEIFGVGRNGTLVFVNETKKHWKYGLPKNFIVIENCDEWIHCLDGKSGDVVSWAHGDIETLFPDFDSFLLSRFCDVLENIPYR